MSESSSLDSDLQRLLAISAPVLDAKRVRKCHVLLPDESKPTSAIVYNDQYYAYVKLFSTYESAQRGVDRLQKKGNLVVLTETHKGLVLWVLELEARPVGKPLAF